MPWNPDKNEIRSIINCEGAERYEYLVKKVCDEGRIYSLWSDGWLLATDVDGNHYVPIWPHPVFAEICAEGRWRHGHAKSINISEWLQKWTIGLVNDKRNIAAFPTKNSKAVPISPLQFHNDIILELENY